jgi:hypothetical protein
VTRGHQRATNGTCPEDGAVDDWPEAMCRKPGTLERERARLRRALASDPGKPSDRESKGTPFNTNKVAV